MHVAKTSLSLVVARTLANELAVYRQRGFRRLKGAKGGRRTNGGNSCHTTSIAYFLAMRQFKL